ncbi:hypothetical protein DRQ53_15805 [bacterium]|nr:MAG: hypothetical protein DRQ53_15805 [bacterium]
MRLRETNRTEFDKLIAEAQAVMGPGGELMGIIISSYGTKLSGLEFVAGQQLVDDMKAIADEVAKDDKYNVAQAWQATIMATLIEAGPAFAPVVFESLKEAFGEGGIPGMESTIAEIEALARVLGLLPEVETVTINVHTRFTQEGTPFDPMYGAPIETRVLNTGGGYAGGRSAFGGNVPALEPQWVGELGPELFVPFNSGTIIPNKDLKSSGDNTTVVNIFRAESNDLPGDISQGLTEASVTRQVDLIGAY